MYLEISNVAAALNKNPYESREKTLLISWARHCPKNVKDYLIKNNCIDILKENEETYSDIQKQVYKKMRPEQFNVNDFSKIENNIVEEYIKKRNNEQSEKEIKQLKEYTKDSLKKNNGNIQECNIIQKEKYVKGNDKMYYYNITEDCCIGGKNDASIDDVLIEIKTRTRKQNVRRNDYDLYQLICYLLATKKNRGKIVQLYNKEKYDSDIGNEQEYGIINITEEPWNNICLEIQQGLKEYFMELSELIIYSKFKYLNNVIPTKIRPIAKYKIIDDNIVFYDENIKFKNLLRYLIK